MVKKTDEQIASRREEIVNACERLYQTMSFKEITLKEIGAEVPFSRPTIYNYFRTKEEIFLALFEREYRRWNDDLNAILDGNHTLGKEEIAEKIAKSLSSRAQLLKLLAMNNYDMEANSREEILTSFKLSYGRSLENIRRILEKFCRDMDAERINGFIYAFFPFMFGIYPYTSVTEKQRAAMKTAGIDYKYMGVYEITYECISALLGEGKREAEHGIR